ncbi:hypothetical protein [Halomonas alimentaria]|uniref:Uncharacterized protein n=1 Tax=Halomonas alimentaria TaxID=147248 RepID=A0A7X5AQT8_9GAMM|nr:hypothetical protein [Halomonas alimentaria]NAW35268.1 hypothetical protein [Halomonas alimentaria]
MAQVVIWLIAFAAILFLSLKRWPSLSASLDCLLPQAMKTGGNNSVVWSLALAVIGATTLVRPVDVLMTAIVVGILVLVAVKLGGWAMSKVDFH